MGEGLYEELARLERGDRRAADPGAHLRAGRQPQGIARLSRPPAARERRQFVASSTASPTSDVLARRAGPRSGRRARGARAQAQSGDPAAATRSSATARRNSAGLDLSAIRWCASRCSKRLTALESRQLDAPSRRSGKGKAQAGHRRRSTAGSRSATVFEASDADVDRHGPRRPRRAARLGRARRRGARARCSTAPPTCSRSIARNSSRCASARPARPCPTRCSKCARRSISCAFMRPRRGASSPGRCRCPARPASSTSCACTAAACSPASRPWNFPLAIFIGPVAAALAAGNAVIAKPAEQTPLIGALAVELMHQAGIPQRRRPAGAGRRQGRRRTLTAHPLIAGRRLHRLDRHRAGDQPHAGRARRADHPADRRDRRPECDDRRFVGAARAGHARRRRLGLPERRPALLGAARAVRPGRCRRRHDRR